LAIREPLKIKLDKMTANKIIKRELEPSQWTSNIVIVKKTNSNDIRICLDPSDLNKAVNRPIYPLPTFE